VRRLHLLALAVLLLAGCATAGVTTVSLRGSDRTTDFCLD
jgi:hypothetical protein